jgi:hypothetical protein
LFLFLLVGVGGGGVVVVVVVVVFLCMRSISAAGHSHHLVCSPHSTCSYSTLSVFIAILWSNFII